MPIFPTGYTQKTTPADDDQVLIGDSAASNAIKRTKISAIVTKAVTAAVTAVQALTNWITTAMLQNASVTKAKIDYTSVDVFSTSEIDTGRKWVDGKTIYRKCFQQSNTNTFNHGISSIDNVLDMRCVVRDAGGTSWRPIPWLYSGSDTNWIAGIYMSTTQVIFQFHIASPTIKNADRVCVMIEYTK